MRKSTLIATASVAVVTGVLAASKIIMFQDLIVSADEFAKTTTIAVTAKRAEETEWRDTYHGVGETEAGNNAIIAADSAGLVSSIHFETGSEVKKGDLLIELEHSIEKAHLNSTKIREELARGRYERTRRLMKDNLVSNADFDNVAAEHRLALSEVESASVRLEKKFVYAPFSGKLGLENVKVGEHINIGAPVVSLQTGDPMSFNFTVPQHQLWQLEKGLPVKVRTDAAPGKVFFGKINAINSEIDSRSRSVRIQASLENPENILISGLFGRVEVALPTSKKVTMVPASSLKYSPYGQSVFTLEEVDNSSNGNSMKAVEKLVEVGPTRGEYVPVYSGISPGDNVIMTGVFKVRNGDAVQVMNEQTEEDLYISQFE